MRITTALSTAVLLSAAAATAARGQVGENNIDAIVQAPPELTLEWPSPEIRVPTGEEFAIWGYVTDEDGIAAIEVALRQRESEGYLTPDGGLSAETSWHAARVVDADGHWRLVKALPAPGTYDLTVRAVDSLGEASVVTTTYSAFGDAIVQAPPELTLEWPSPEIRVPTGEEFAIWGYVTDEDGIAAIEVALRQRESEGYLTPDGGLSAETSWHAARVVDADGHWRLVKALPASGTYDLTVRAVDNLGEASVVTTTYSAFGDAANPRAAGFFGEGLVDNPAFWLHVRGVAFSVDSAGRYLDAGRLEEALQQVGDLGFNAIRTWRTDAFTTEIFEAIDRLGLDIKVQAGVFIDNRVNAFAAIDQALAVIEPHKDKVLSLSVGNEALAYWNEFHITEQAALDQIAYIKDRSSVPLTYNFSIATLYDVDTFWNENGAAVVDALDYVSFHSYGGYFQNQFDTGWNPWLQRDIVGAHAADVRAILGTHGVWDKPIVLGETGWRTSNGLEGIHNAQSAEIYYEITTAAVYGDAIDVDSMFYFSLTDEAWKGADDGWGLFFEGDAKSIGLAKFPIAPVDDITGRPTLGLSGVYGVGGTGDR